MAISTALIGAGAGVAAAAPNVSSPQQNSQLSETDLGNNLATVPGTTKIIDKDSQAGDFSLELPGTETSTQAISPSDIPATLFEGKGAALVNTELQDAAISTFATAAGSQSIIKIDSHSAATDYRFALEMPQGATARVLQDGSVDITGSDGASLGSVRTPWAYDANGATVSTSFAIDGNTLVQTIQHTPDTAFPVVADPSTAWGWTLCGASIGALVAGNLLIASKITKLGGVAKVIIKLKAAKNADARYKALIAFFGEFTGIGAVLNNCK